MPLTKVTMSIFITPAYGLSLLTLLFLAWYGVPPIIRWFMRPRIQATTPGWGAINILLSLETRIRAGEYSEARLTAWLEWFSSDGDQPITMDADEHQKFLEAIGAAAFAMESMGWQQKHIDAFRRRGRVASRTMLLYLAP
jgi:hypothetical protein